MINKTLSNKIYYTTFILAVFIIAMHSSYLEVLNPNSIGYGFSYFVQKFFFVVGDSAVPTFFVISGFLLFSNYTLKNYPKMLLKKVFSLVIPYFVWSVLAFIFMQIIYPLMRGETIQVSFNSAIIDILLANSYPHLWFIRPLLIFFVFSPLFYFIFKYLKKWSIFIPIILFFVYLLFRPEYGGIVVWIPLFFIGSYLAYFDVSIFKESQSRLNSVIALVVFILFAVALTCSHSQYEDNAYYCYRYIAPLLVWFSIDLLTPLFKKEKIREIFKTSGFIFFSHLGIVNGFKEILQLGISVESNNNCTFLFFMTLILSTAVVLLITYLLKRFAKPVYKFLGGR